MMSLLDFGPRQTVLLVLFVCYIVYRSVSTFFEDRKVERLGGYATRIKSWIPLGLEFPYNTVKAARKNAVFELWDKMYKDYGCDKTGSYTVELKILNQERILLSACPENIKAVLTTQFWDFGKGTKFHGEWRDFLGDSIFATDGDIWQHSRNLIRPMFMRERVADLDVLEEHVAKLLKLMGSGQGEMVRFDKLLSRFTLDAATQFLFDQTAGSLEDENAQFGVAFDEVQRVQALVVRAGPLKHLISKKSFWEGLNTMDRCIEPWISSTLALSPAELEAKSAKTDTFIHALARHTRDRKVIRDQLVSLLLAGRDTTYSTLSWIFLELARNPQVVKKLRAEITSTVAEGEHPTYQQIKEMKYLNYVINETLRLYPVVPFNVRTALTDTTLPRGGGPNMQDPIGITKGTVFGYSTLMLQRRRDLYPPISEDFPYDPLEWVPERWYTWTPKSWHYIPFNGGPRICIGQQFALVEMGYAIVRILQEFEKVVDYGNPVILKTDILMTPGEGVKVGFVRPSKQGEK